jgi:hypothetical protein
VKYTFEDFCDPAGELPEDAPRIDLLEKEITDLKAQVSDLKAQFGDLKSSIAYVDEWFLRHISALADAAAKEFRQKRETECVLSALEKAELNKQVQQATEEAVETIFKREANELAKAILSRIHPYALRR